MQTFSCTQVQSTDHTSSSAKPAVSGRDDFKQALAGVMQSDPSVSDKKAGGGRSDVSGAGSKNSGNSEQPDDKGQEKQSSIITDMTDTSLLAGLMALQSSGIAATHAAGSETIPAGDGKAVDTSVQTVNGNNFTYAGNIKTLVQTFSFASQTASTTVPNTAEQPSKPVDVSPQTTGSIRDILTRLNASDAEISNVNASTFTQANALQDANTQSSTAVLGTNTAMPSGKPNKVSVPDVMPLADTSASVQTGQSTGTNFMSMLHSTQSQTNGVSSASNPAGQSTQAAGNQAAAATQPNLTAGAVGTITAGEAVKDLTNTQTEAINAVASVSDSVKAVQTIPNAPKSSGGSAAKDDEGKQQGKTDVASVINLHSNKAAQATVTDTGTTQKVDTSDIARQISDACKTAVDTGKSEIRIHLSPEELGGINIKIVSQNGVLSIQISADSRHTGEMLAQNMGDLNRSMSDNGVSMNKVEILYAQTGSFSSQFGSGSGGQQNYSGQSGSTTTWVAMNQASAESESSTIEAIPAGDEAADYSRLSIFA